MKCKENRPIRSDTRSLCLLNSFDKAHVPTLLPALSSSPRTSVSSRVRRGLLSSRFTFQLPPPLLLLTVFFYVSSSFSSLDLFILLWEALPSCYSHIWPLNIYIYIIQKYIYIHHFSIFNSYTCILSLFSPPSS